MTSEEGFDNCNNTHTLGAYMLQSVLAKKSWSAVVVSGQDATTGLIGFALMRFSNVLYAGKSITEM